MKHNQIQAVGRNLLKDRSARRSGGYVHNTQQTLQTNVHALCRTRSHYPNYRAAADLRLRPQGRRNRPVSCYMTRNEQNN